MNQDEWHAKGEQLFGPDIMRWRFVCPSCGHVASVQDWKDAGASEGAVAFSCVGCYLPTCNEAFGGNGSGPCNYAGGGLYRLNPVDVEGRPTFAFAEEIIS
jgi:TPP-dependent indolepyruvate ferredoxin oxidoreductase alpha subunit